MLCKLFTCHSIISQIKTKRFQETPAETADIYLGVNQNYLIDDRYIIFETFEHELDCDKKKRKKRG